jgi:Domain of unknown function (DUF4383)
MATSASTPGRTGDRHRDDDRGRTPAQYYAYLVGAVLVLVGILGFIADGSFDTSASGDTDALGNANGMLQGDSFLGFEVNGWHNVVHIASGLFLLAMAPKRRTAKLGVLAFGVIYGIVTIIGIIDGNDVLGLFPVNAADNVLHVLLTAAAFLAAFASPADDRDGHRDRGIATTTDRHVVADATLERGERTSGERLVPRDLNRVDDR